MLRSRVASEAPRRNGSATRRNRRHGAEQDEAYVSDDNPYSESQFRTLKYRPEFPDRFGCIQDGRAFCQQFFQWHNQEHRHSGIGLLTPAMVHFGEAQSVLERRQLVLDAAYLAHPDRFVRRPPRPLPLPSEVWINKPIPGSQTTKEKSQ